MGDRTSVTLTIPTVYKEASLAIFDANGMSPQDSFSNGGVKDYDLHCFCFYEVNCGTLEFLDELVATGIPFDSEWGAGSEYGPGCATCRFTHDGDAERKEVPDDSKNPELTVLMSKLDDYQALKDYILHYHNTVTSMPWDNQVKYSKVYRLKKLITAAQETNP